MDELQRFTGKLAKKKFARFVKKTYIRTSVADIRLFDKRNIASIIPNGIFIVQFERFL